MKTIYRIFIMTGIALTTLTSCEELDFLTDEGGLTEQEVVEGLRQALIVGTDTAVSRLNITDGFYGDEAVRIFLPKEAQPVYDVLNLLPTSIVENNILAINRAAEDAASEAKPIFIDAIRDLTINDGFSILQGEDTAATSYLRGKTRQRLFDAFQPKIETSLSKDLVLNISASELYSQLINAYNTASLGGFLFDEIKTNSLSVHTTNWALRGLFLKVANEERLIRTDASHRVTEVLEKVFGDQG